jgi:hypothetical protein
MLALLESFGRDATGGSDALLGVAVGAVVVGIVWWRGARAPVRGDQSSRT